MNKQTKKPVDEITPSRVYDRRRAFMRGGISAFLATAALMPTKVSAFSKLLPLIDNMSKTKDPKGEGEVKLAKPGSLEELLQSKIASAPVSTLYTTDEIIADQKQALSFNNFYEFGTAKTDPSTHGHQFNPLPWSVKISGLKTADREISLVDILQRVDLEERVLRLRCVEAWSMVLPWVVFPLHQLLGLVEPKDDAKYVRFQTVHRPEEMPGQRALFSSINYPYVEGLRLDEAYHPLACVAVGLYRNPLLAQSGAPIRLLLPWKYGFKSIKSIDTIQFVKERPLTTWEKAWPEAYGFYANVNPEVNHPGWSQATERRLPSKAFFSSRIATRLWNGYDEVAGVYEGMSLNRNY